MAVYFIYGDDDYSIDLKLKELRSKLNSDFLSMCYKSLDNPKFENLINVLRSTPMMFGSSLSVIDAAKYFYKEDYNFDDKELEEIENALKDNQDGIDIAFVVRASFNEGKKIDSRKKLYKILSKYNSIELQIPAWYKTDEIIPWIKNRAKEKKIKINDDAISALIEHFGANYMQLNSELDKLQLVAYPDNTITKELVNKNCSSNEDLFNITNYLLKGEKGKAVLEYRQLLNKKYPLEILSAIQTMLRQWIIVKAKSTAPAKDIIALSGIKSEYRIQALKRDLKDISLKDLVKLKENLFDIEYRIKIGLVTDMESEVEIALIR